MMPEPDYSAESLVEALRNVGVQKGDILFCHVSMGRLGRPSCAPKSDAVCALLFEGLEKALGAEGTLLLPTYTYSIGRNEPFEVEHTVSTVGPITEFFRKLPGVIRSRDPMLSVAGKGPAAERLFRDLPPTCYGRGSLYERLRSEGAKLCTIGLPLHWATFRHHIEELAAVPFRFSKLFAGRVVAGGRETREVWSYHAPVRLDSCAPSGERLQFLLREKGVCQVAAFGRSEIWCIGAEAYFQNALAELARDPWLTAVGPGSTLSELVLQENQRVGAVPACAEWETGMEQLADVPWKRPLAAISEERDAILRALGDQFPMTIHEFPSGTPCGETVVPEKWIEQEVFLEMPDGKSVSDGLRAIPYSPSFSGEVSHDELRAHLHTGALEATPFDFACHGRDWGLLVTESFRRDLAPGRYRISIRTATCFGTLKVAEAEVPGKTADFFVLAAELGESGERKNAAIGVEVLRRLQKQGAMRHGVRLVIVDETFGWKVWLGHGATSSGAFKGGLFLGRSAGVPADAGLVPFPSASSGERWQAVESVMEILSKWDEAPGDLASTNDTLARV